MLDRIMGTAGCVQYPNGEWVARCRLGNKRGFGRTADLAMASLRRKVRKQLDWDIRRGR